MGENIKIYESFRRSLGPEFLPGLKAHERDVTGNCRVKLMGGLAEVCVCDQPIFKDGAYEAHADKPSAARRREKAHSGDRDADLKRSARRAAQKLREYALCNELPYFCTFTLDGSKCDRYDASGVVRTLNQWLDNRVRRKGLRYIVVPEWHKDGAIHFHGLVNDVLPRVDSGTMIPPEGGKPKRPRSKRQRAAWLDQGSQIVYNLPDWSLGFSTAVLIQGDYHRTVNYVCKYITKQQEHPKGKVAGRWYYHGGDLAEAEIRLCWWSLAEAVAAGATVYHVPEVGRSFAYVTFRREALNL